MTKKTGGGGGVDPGVLDGQPLLAWIAGARQHAAACEQFAQVVQARAKAAADQYGAKTAYVQQQAHAARTATAAAAGAAAAVNRVMHEKAARIHELMHPRNGNANHEMAADLGSALMDHKNITNENR